MQTAWMDFRTAANILGQQITTADMAEALGVSPHSVRQARLQDGAPGFRKPPEDWSRVFVRLARERCSELKAFIEELERST
jgi:hypothetical protein